ncbi:uncharacterized protein BO96DRAFT_379963 [Aspergillus niger CBS 101883]|uniref:uncharacterized protein n=1 Tax=Aspergillus lacticoffeatus (strain CBS 101883) TaxID=1450533 RepID=UPI000D7FAAA7|nr:uncharacterized protein BO96DRAFT_379963 [Aspergillus niger CBS 101883]PYH50100.1 hypothetical protein BO96DRAFT_379963 [Aspergillus niger CBS 101883]
MVLRYHPCPSISELIPDEDTLELYRQHELAGHGETGLSGLSLKEKQVIERLQARQQDLPLLNMLLQALRIPGLRPGFMAGNINRLLRMKCPHEHAHYIQHILNVWTYIMGPQNVSNLDAESVRLLQGRSPVWSTADHDFIRRLLSVGVLFPGVTDPERRTLLARRLLSVTTIIPSLRTFMEDTKYLLPSHPNHIQKMAERRSSTHTDGYGYSPCGASPIWSASCLFATVVEQQDASIDRGRNLSAVGRPWLILRGRRAFVHPKLLRYSSSGGSDQFNVNARDTSKSPT